MTKKKVASPPPVKAEPSLSELSAAVAELEKRKKFRVIDFFQPYPKQLEFFNLGATCRERMLSAANQVGKSRPRPGRNYARFRSSPARTQFWED